MIVGLNVSVERAPVIHVSNGVSDLHRLAVEETVAGHAAEEPPVLQVENLSVTFNGPAGPASVIEGVSFSVSKGRTVALVGESGSGKSVTSLAIMGLLSRRDATVSGRINYCDSANRNWELARLKDSEMDVLRGDRIAMIFQEPMTSLNPVLTVGDQIAEVLLIHRNMPRRERQAATIRMLERVGIPEPRRRANAYPHELSGGMRQRIMIGMALICQPDVLIADEATTALDVTIQAQILADLQNLQKQLGMGMLFVTHDLGVVAEIAHSVAVMYAGQVVESGPVDAILRNPRHPYTLALLASIPRIDTDRHARLNAISGAVPDPHHKPDGCRFHPRCRHAVAGLCDTQSPAEEEDADGHMVRCLRWRTF